MDNVKYLVDTQELNPPINGYRYNVVLKISLDGGKTYSYAGIGKYCKTFGDALTAAVDLAMDGHTNKINTRKGDC